MSSERRRLSEADQAGSGDELRERTLAGVRWFAVGRFGAQALTFASTVVVARLIVPADFGRAAVAIALWSVATAVAVQGLGGALVQRERIDRRHLEAAAWLALICGIAVTAVILLVGWLVVQPAVDAETAHLTQLVSIGFIIGAAATVPSGILSRRLDFRQLAINEVVSQVVQVIVTLALAIAGLGAWAIVTGALAGSTAQAAMAMATAPSALPRPHRGVSKELFAFAGPVQGAAFVYSCLRYSGVTLVGALLGPASAGLFQRAYTLGMEYQTKVSSIMLTIAFPVYSRAESISAAIALRRRIVRVHATALFPFLLLLAATAPVLVPWIYGDKWQDAASLTQWTAIAGLSSVVLTGTGPIVTAVGRPGALLNYNVASLIAYVVAIVIGCQFGLTAACIALVIFNTLNLVCAQYFLLGRIVGIPFTELASDAGPALASGLPLVLIAAVMTSSMHAAGVADPLTLAAASIVGLAAYATTLRVVFPAAFRDLSLLADRVTGISRVRPLARRALARQPGAR